MRIFKPCITVAIFAVTLVAPAAAFAADQFDLHCVGTVQSGTKPAEPWKETYRVDLLNGRWCANTCPAVLGIARADAGEIVFIDRDDRPTGRWVEKMTVNRSSGRLVHRVVSLDLDWAGTCEPAPFTAIPETKF